MPSACSTSDSFGVQAVSPRYSQQLVARVDQHRHRPAAGEERPHQAGDHGRRQQPRPVVGDQHRVGAAQRPPGRTDPRLTPRLGNRIAGVTVDAHDLLLGRVDAAGEDPRLDRRPIAAGPHDGRVSTPRGNAASTRRPGSSRPASATRSASPPSAATFCGGVAGAAGADVGGVVLEDEHRRLARHAGDATRHVLVGDEVAQHDDAAAARGPQQGGEACGGRIGGSLRHAAAHRLTQPPDQAPDGGPAARITAAASARVSQIA